VLEHPYASSLWKAVPLPPPGQRDAWGGFTYPVYQGHFGHKAPKATWLYIVGVEPFQLPTPAFSLTLPEGRIACGCSKKQREGTPSEFAEWLRHLVLMCDLRQADLFRPGPYVIPGQSPTGWTSNPK